MLKVISPYVRPLTHQPLLTPEMCFTLTRPQLTYLAAFPREALRTVAAIAVTFLQAAPSVETGVGLARVILSCVKVETGNTGRLSY